MKTKSPPATKINPYFRPQMIAINKNATWRESASQEKQEKKQMYTSWMFLSDQRLFKMSVSLSHGEYITADSAEDLHQQKTPQGAENESSALEERATMSIISNLSVSLKRMLKSSTFPKRHVFPLLFGIDCFQLSIHRNTTAFINYWVESRGSSAHLRQVKVYRLNKFNTTKKTSQMGIKRFNCSSGKWTACLEIQTYNLEGGKRL